MKKSIFFILLLTLFTSAFSKELVNKRVGLKDRLAIDLVYVDGERMTLLIPYIFWRKFLAKLTGIKVTDNKGNNALMKKIYINKIYYFNKLNDKLIKDKTLLKQYINHFKVMPVLYSDLGYSSFIEFLKANFKCIASSKLYITLKELNSHSLVSDTSKAYILGTNGATLKSRSYYGNDNLIFELPNKNNIEHALSCH